MATTRVLIVDDEGDIRALLARLVTGEGYEPVLARDGEEALHALVVSAPDILLLDIKMPGLSGLEVLREVQRLRPGLPVVMMSAQSGDHDLRDAFLAGACDYLVKPFAHEDVLTTLRRICLTGGGERLRALHAGTRTHGGRVAVRSSRSQGR